MVSVEELSAVRCPARILCSQNKYAGLEEYQISEGQLSDRLFIFRAPV